MALFQALLEKANTMSYCRSCWRVGVEAPVSNRSTWVTSDLIVEQDRRVCIRIGDQHPERARSRRGCGCRTRCWWDFEAANPKDFDAHTGTDKQEVSSERINDPALARTESLNNILRVCNDWIAVRVKGTGHDLAMLPVHN